MVLRHRLNSLEESLRACIVPQVPIFFYIMDTEDQRLANQCVRLAEKTGQRPPSLIICPLRREYREPIDRMNKVYDLRGLR
jgi:hypothetical protein